MAGTPSPRRSNVGLTGANADAGRDNVTFIRLPPFRNSFAISTDSTTSIGMTIL